MSEILDKYLLPVIGMVGSIIAAILLIRASRDGKLTLFKERNPTSQEEGSEKEVASTSPSTGERTIPPSQVDRVREELGALSLEKEIVGFALTRLFEAEAEGSITRQDQARLLDKYRTEMEELDGQIKEKRMIVKLHELESDQSELINSFNQKLEEVNREIENIRASLSLAQPIRASIEKDDQKKDSKDVTENASEGSSQNKHRNSEAEKRLESIQEEVLRVLDRLEKLESGSDA